MGGRRLRYRWVIAARPRGSRARLHGAASVRPRFRPDRPGRYRLRPAVFERRTGAASAAQAATTSASDAVTVTINPANVLVPVTTYYFDSSAQRWGIQIGENSYLNPAPGGRGMQVLVVDRDTLEVQNGYLSSAQDLLNEVTNMGLDQVVVLFNAPNLGAPVAAGDVPTFDKVPNLLGVPANLASDTSLLTNPGQILSVIGRAVQRSRHRLPATDAVAVHPGRRLSPAAELPGAGQPHRRLRRGAVVHRRRDRPARLSVQLRTAYVELDWLDNVKALFDGYKVPYDRAQGPNRVNLQSIESAIEDSVKPPSDAVFWDISSWVRSSTWPASSPRTTSTQPPSTR